MFNTSQCVSLGITQPDRAGVMQAHQDSRSGILVRSSIGPRPAVKHVGAGATIERVITAVAVKCIVTPKTMQDVVSIVTIYRSGAR